MFRANPADRAAATDRRLRCTSLRIRLRRSMPWLIVALLLFAASIVAALLQYGAVSAAFALAAIAVAVASQLTSTADARANWERSRTDSGDDPRPANHEP